MHRPAGHLSTFDNRERGAVSIFIVIFFALLISVITMSFIGIVIRGNTQSSNNDLSRSAYDSAQAGVEDGKRAIAVYGKDCADNGQAACDARYASSFSDTDCTAFGGFLGSLHPGVTDATNVPVQSSSANGFNQAYTCVTLKMNTPDYVNSTTEYTSDIIPLRGTDGFDRVNLNWFTHTDANAPSDTTAFTPRNTGSGVLPKESDWDGHPGAYTPPLMRVQLISYGSTITTAGLQSDSRTLFLYPSTGPTTTVSFDNPSSLVPVTCGGTGTYACNISLLLGGNVGKTSYLRVTPIYKNTTFQLELQQGSTNVLFNGVQPVVDSTGRANDLYRRVEARVRLQNNVTYPEFAIDSQASLCKDYAIGSIDADFKNLCN